MTELSYLQRKTWPNHNQGKALAKIDSTTVVQVWLKSQAYFKIMEFIERLTLSIKSKSCKAKATIPDHVQNVRNVLDDIRATADSTELIDSATLRFGNPAFRIFVQRMNSSLMQLLLKHIGPEYESIFVELAGYLSDSFGNETRIDYGTGHELHFIAFLCCLYDVQYFNEADLESVFFDVIVPYIKFVHKLISYFKLEPAGNQGFLLPDEYQYIPFLLGSAQMISNGQFGPSDLVPLDREGFEYTTFLKMHADDYIIMCQLLNINQCKTGPFCQHSKMLWDISATETCNKLYTGFFKMYKFTILAKQPMIQHFLFGTILSPEPVEPVKS